MKKLTILLCIVLSFITITKASHIIGSDITYKCLNTSGLFEIRFYLYRDCSGVKLCKDSCGAPCSISLQIAGNSQGCNNNNFGSVSLSLVSVRDVNLTPECVTSKNICNNMGCVTPGTLTPGVERYEFVGQVNLGPTSSIPSSCCEVKLTYSLCCRNYGITTGQASTNFYTEAIINRCLSINPCNSSPILTNDPMTQLCSGQPVIFNSGAIDPDLDSISYAFVPALSSSGASAPYTPPYTFDRPLPWSGPADGSFPAGIKCNPQTGEVLFTPVASNNFIGVAAIGMVQWRKNPLTGQYQKVGETRRDMMVWIKTCEPNNPPTIRTEPSLQVGSPSPRVNWDICAGEELCFDVIAKDTDIAVSDTTYLSWNAALSQFGARFTPAYNPSQRRFVGPREDRYTFCWTPQQEHESNLPYYFVVYASDSKCPTPGKVARAFSIKVAAKPFVKLVIDSLGCGQFNIILAPYNNNSVSFTHKLYVTSVPNDRSFSQQPKLYDAVNGLTQYQFSDSGMYYVKAELQYSGSNLCPLAVIDSFYTTYQGYTCMVRDTAFCDPDTTIIIKPILVNPNNFPIKLRWWSVLKPGVLLSQNDSLVINKRTLDYRYVLESFSDSTACTKYDTFWVYPIANHLIAGIEGERNPFVTERYYYSAYSNVATCFWTANGGTIVSGQGTRSIYVLWNESGNKQLTCAEVRNGCLTTPLTFNVNVKEKQTLSTSEIEAKPYITVKPNPANLFINIESNRSLKNTTIQVHDITGKKMNVVLTEHHTLTIDADISILASGYYFISIDWKDGNVVRQKFVKQD